MNYYNDISDLIGRTPLVRINKVNPFPDITILAKLEQFNPGGSVKDRIARSLIEDAEKRGLLNSDKTIIESTSGNTGIGIAMLCALKRYQCELVMPESMSIERRKIMMAYGAKVILTPAEEGTDGARNYVKRRLAEDPERYFSPNQYDNPANWKAHYETTAQEIFEDTDGKITHFVAGLGTSGTLMGVARGLKERISEVQIVSVEPKPNSFIQGMRDLCTQTVPKIFRESLLDERIHVSDIDAERTAKALGFLEGVFSGLSSGAAMFGALEVARALSESDYKDALIVVLLADSGERYISKSQYSLTIEAEQAHSFPAELLIT
ncbi:MAG: PLP-dependent cysteine synthase family protein [Promethearchaeota archaeon]